MLAAIRAFMAEHGVLEVDTPLISRAAPGERGLDCFQVAGEHGYLVPSPEHALKRLLAGGSGAIYQLGHVFRAGEAGRWHNPEFCMLEWYRPGDDMRAAIEHTSALLAAVADAPVTSQTTYRKVFAHATGVDPLTADGPALAAAAQRLGVAPESAVAEDRVFWLDLLMSLVVQPGLGATDPVCVTHFPADDAVLVALDPDDPRCAQRFEIFWRGVELANGAQELTDPELARVRIERENAARRAAGKASAAPDERLLAAMTVGLPACAGVALGVDRLLALTLGQTELAAALAFDWARR